MKQKIINILFLLAFLTGGCNSSKAQTNFNLGAGYSSDKNIVAQIGLNEEIGKFAIGAEIRPSITRSVNSMQLFGFRGGINVLNSDNAIIPFVGYYYNKFSDSKQQKGQWITGYGIRCVKMITQIGGIYFEPCLISKNVQVTGGVIFKF